MSNERIDFNKLLQAITAIEIADLSHLGEKVIIMILIDSYLGKHPNPNKEKLKLLNEIKERFRLESI